MIQPDESPLTTQQPHSVDGIPIRNLWYMLLYAWNEMRVKDRWKAEIETAPTLDALLATILANLLEQRLRIGLGRQYRTDESLISGVRGRVRFAESLRRLSFEHGKAYCRFQTFGPNVPKNQIIRSTLVRLVQLGQFGPDRAVSKDLSHRLRGLARALHMVDLIELKPDVIGRERSQRHDTDYRLMLAICGLILQRQMPTESVGLDELPNLDRDAMILWKVFELFVANFYRARLTEWTVTAQPQWRWPATPPSMYLPVLRPDLMLVHRPSGRIVVLDTKFTASLLSAGYWGNQTFNRDHLFQIYAYLRSQEQVSEQHAAAAGMLLYPAVGRHYSEITDVQGHRIQWETIDLSRDWETIEDDLLCITSSLVGAS